MASVESLNDFHLALDRPNKTLPTPGLKSDNLIASGGEPMFFKPFVFCLTVTALAVAGAAADLHDGTWLVNVSKSKYTTHPPPKSGTITVTEDATIHHVTFSMVMDDGKPMNGELAFPLKGGIVEVKGFPPDPQMDHGSAKVVSKSKWVFSYFDKDNKLTLTLVVTTDGKMTEAKSFVGDKLLENEVSERQ